MIRFIDNHAKWLLAYLSLLPEDAQGHVYEQVSRRVRELEDRDEGVTPSTRDLAFLQLQEERYDGLNAPEISELTRLIERQLENGGDEAGLVDKIAELLKLPHMQREITGRTLRRLREAVLTGDEIAQLPEVEDVGPRCAGCEIPLDQRMAVAAYNRKFYCTRCLCPGNVPCSCNGCTQIVPIKTWGKAHYCEEHKPKKEGKEKAEPGERLYRIFQGDPPVIQEVAANAPLPIIANIFNEPEGER